jgi:hypothetical protein
MCVSPAGNVASTSVEAMRYVASRSPQPSPLLASMRASARVTVTTYTGRMRSARFHR